MRRKSLCGGIAGSFKKNLSSEDCCVQFARRHFISIKEVFNRSKIQEKINSRTISHSSVPLHSTSNLLYILFFLHRTAQSDSADSVPSVSLFVY